MNSGFRLKKLSALLMASLIAVPPLQAQVRPGFNFNLPVQQPVTDSPPTREGVQEPHRNNDAITTDSLDADNGDPVIKLPSLPPRRNNSPARSSPSGSHPGTNRAGSRDNTANPAGTGSLGLELSATNMPGGNVRTMVGLNPSAFPAMSCPLIAQERTHKDLVEAITALTNVVRPVPECQNNADVNRISETVKGMVDSATALGTMWQSADSIGDSGKAITDMQANLSHLISGVNGVTGTLQNNTLLNSACGKSLTSAGALSAVGDLVSAIAPIALAGAVLSGGVGVVMPYVLGLTGAASVTKIIKTMNDEGTLKLDKPEERLAVLQNICEYTKIRDRITKIKMAEKDGINALYAKLNSDRMRTMQSLRSQYSERVLEIDRLQTPLRRQLLEAGTQLRRDRIRANRYTNLPATSDSAMICEVSLKLAGSAQTGNEFPGTAVANLQRLMGLQTEPNLLQESALNVEQNLRRGLLANVEEMRGRVDVCAAQGRRYLSSVSAINDISQETLGKLKLSLDAQLREDVEYRDYMRTEEIATSEIRDMEKIASALRASNMNAGVFEKIEIERQMIDLTRALFGPPSGRIWPFRGSSPAMAWLTNTDDYMNRSLAMFDTEMRALVTRAFELTPSYRGRNGLITLTGRIATDSDGIPILDQTDGGSQEVRNARLAAYQRDRQAALNLSNITPQIFAAPGEQSERALELTCHGLQNIWFYWSTALDHLAAEAFFCRSIERFFDSRTEPSLRQLCQGKQDLLGNVQRASGLARTQNRLTQNNYLNKSALISSKLNELSCPGASESSVTNPIR